MAYENTQLTPAGDILPDETGVNAPMFPEGVHSDTGPYDGDVYIGHIPEDLDVSPEPEGSSAVVSLGVDPEEVARRYVLDDKTAEMIKGRPKPTAEAAAEERIADRAGTFPGSSPVPPTTGVSTKERHKPLTSRQKNANERRHTAEARRIRWGR